jgi:predicted nucleic acid-binding protein
MITAVDTPVLLDVLIPGAPHAADSERRLAEALAAGPLVICPIVVAELGACFPREEDLRGFLRETGLRVDPFAFASLYLAGRAWREYSRREEGSRGEMASDEGRGVGGAFLIGAHAMVQAEQLLTRDPDFYHLCFPALRLST